MQTENLTPQVAPERSPKTSFLSKTRGKVANTLRSIGLGAFLFVASTAGEAIVHEASGEALKAEKTPSALKYAHEKINKELGEKVDADVVARQISASHSDHVRTIEDLDGIFDPTQIDGDRLVIGGKRFHVKIGSSKDYNRHFVAVDRTAKQPTNPHLLGVYIEEEGEDVSPEEGMQLALQNAAANLSETSENPVTVALNQRDSLETAISSTIPSNPPKENTINSGQDVAVTREEDILAMK